MGAVTVTNSHHCTLPNALRQQATGFPVAFAVVTTTVRHAAKAALGRVARVLLFFVHIHKPADNDTFG